MCAQKENWTKSVFNQFKQHRTTDVDDVSPKRERRAAKSLMAPLSKPFGCNERNTTSWIELFAPKTSEELAVHAKKIGEFRDWLQHCDEMLKRKTPAQLCLLSGPSGAGKTALVHVLAEEAQYSLQEWVNPVDVEAIGALSDQAAGSSYTGSQLEAFKAFLLRASRYRSLQDKFDKRLILVEDFPNMLISDAATFAQILSDYKSYGKSPLVFVVADSKSRSLNIAYNLFSDELKAKFQVQHISLNPIATMLMQKALKRFCALMRAHNNSFYEMPVQSTLDSLLVCAQGDIRNLLINLHFSALRGAPRLQTKPIQEQPGKSKSKSKPKHTLKSVGRDESITMMHALGRVFYPKYTEEQRLSHNPEDIADLFCTEPYRFTQFVHANYMQHFCSIDEIAAAADGLSVADLMLAEYRSEDLALTGLIVAIRSVMVANKRPSNAWRPVRGLKRFEPLDQNNFQHKELLCEAVLSRRLYAVEYHDFLKRIAAKRK